MIRIAEPRIGEKERQAVLEVLASGRLTGGPYTRKLEEAFARRVSGTTEAVAVSSGTAALHLALLAHGIGPGDEVITTPFTFQATANMVLAVGARPVFVDVLPNGNLDPNLVEAAITPRTKALLPVHLYGRLCDMPPLCDIAARHHLALIEDAAQAHGATLPSANVAKPTAPLPATNPLSLEGEGRGEGAPDTPDATSERLGQPSPLPAGSETRGEDASSDHSPYGRSQADATNPLSLEGEGRGEGAPDTPETTPDAVHPTSPLPAGRGVGGEEAPSASPRAGRGVSPAGSFGTGCFSLYATKNLTAGEGGIVTTNDPDLAQRLRRLRSHGEADRYESIEVGYNYRITEVGAALALSQLESLAEANQRRRENAAYLSQHLHGVEVPEMPDDAASHVWHQYTIRVLSPLSAGGKGVSWRGRHALQAHLRDRGIEAMVYYPKTLPAQKLYRDLGYDDAALPMARRLADEVLSLPVHPGLSPADLDAIVSAVNEWTALHQPGRVASL